MNESSSDGKQVDGRETSLGKLQVGMILRQFHPHMTGVVTQYRQMGPAFRERNVSLVVHTTQTSLAPEPEAALDGIRIRRRKIGRINEEVRGGENDFRLLRETYSCWVRGDCLPDVVVVFMASRKMLPYLIGLKRKGVRLILAVTIFPEFDNKPSWWTWVKWSVETFFLLGLFDSIVVYSTTFLRLYASVGVSRKNLQVIPFPVDCKKFSPCVSDAEKQSVRKKLGLEGGGEIVVFMGSVIQRKGADLLLEAWSRLEQAFPTARLVFVGPYGRRETLLTEALRSEHQQFICRFEGLLNRLERRDAVILTGTVDNPQDYFKAADIFAFPSHLEGMGGVIPEAMASGLPCVLTKFEGFPETEFGEPGRDYLAVDFNPKSIAAAVGCLLEFPHERQRIGGNGRRRVLKLFDLPLIADKFINVCRGLPT